MTVCEENKHYNCHSYTFSNWADVYFINTRKAKLQLIDCWLKQPLLLVSFLQTNIWNVHEEKALIILYF